MNVSAPKYWRICGFLGIALTVFGILLMDVFPQSGHDIPPGYGGPVFAFEMAATQADLIAVFGPVGDPLRADRIAQMDTGNWWDFPFMVIYALFMATFLWAAHRATGKKIWAALACIALVSGVFDAVENILLLGLTADLDSARNIELLTYPVWGKFLAISASIIAAGIFILSHPHMVWRFLGIATILGGGTILCAFYAPSEYGILIRNGVTIGWLAMLIYALKRSVGAPQN